MTSQLVSKKWSVKVDGNFYENTKSYEGRNTSEYYNDARQAIIEEYGEERVEKIDNVSRVIYLTH